VSSERSQILYADALPDARELAEESLVI
jgi:hypothetical protein